MDGFSSSRIGEMLGRGKNVVVVEVRRNGGKENYDPVKAQRESDKRHERKITSSQRRRDGVLPTLSLQVKSLIDKGHSFWTIRKDLGTNYITLCRVYKYLGLPSPHAYTMMESIEERIYNFEQQLEVIFELLKGKSNGK